MINVIKFLVLTLALMNVNIAYSLERAQVKDNRTSMDYAPQVRDFINKVTNYKWEAENGEGFYFIEADKPYESEFANQNMFLNVKTYFYGKPTGESLRYVIQSKFVGFLEVVDWENSTILNLRLLPDGSLESYMSNSEIMKFRKVQEWTENPDPVEDTPSAEERGFVF